MSKYAGLDAELVSFLKREPGRHPIHDEGLLAQAWAALEVPAVAGSDKAWRLLDRRMSALQRAGAIRYDRRGARWVVVERKGETS